jgi:hypothetical protein
VSKRHTHEWGEIILLVQEGLRCAQCRRHLMWWGRYTCCQRERCTPSPDPILTRSQLTRLQPSAAHAIQQYTVDFLDESDRDRKLG